MAAAVTVLEHLRKFSLWISKGKVVKHRLSTHPALSEPFIPELFILHSDMCERVVKNIISAVSKTLITINWKPCRVCHINELQKMQHVANFMLKGNIKINRVSIKARREKAILKSQKIDQSGRELN